MDILPATPADTPEIDALLDTAFGPGRHARTAARLRAGAVPLWGPSLVARAAGGALAGSIQLWPVALDTEGVRQSLTLIGPVAVAPGLRAIGLGRRLIAASLARADAAGIEATVLIGDHSYYGPFGFTAAATGGWSLPGPVERCRLLLRHRADRSLPRVASLVTAGAPVSQPMMVPAAV